MPPGPEAHLPVPHQEPAAVLRPRQRRKAPTEPDFWYGTTITGPDDAFFFWDKVNTFVSVEPLLEPFDTEATGGENPFEPRWVIIGAMTGPGEQKQQPKREWVEAIVKKAREAGAAVFMLRTASSLIWGDDILREHPPGMIGGDNSGCAKENRLCFSQQTAIPSS